MVSGSLFVITFETYADMLGHKPTLQYQFHWVHRNSHCLLSNCFVLNENESQYLDHWTNGQRYCLYSDVFCVPRLTLSEWKRIDILGEGSMICALVIIDNSVITAAGRHIYASLVESGSPITVRKVIRLAKSVDNYCRRSHRINCHKQLVVRCLSQTRARRYADTSHCLKPSWDRGHSRANQW